MKHEYTEQKKDYTPVKCKKFKQKKGVIDLTGADGQITHVTVHMGWCTKTDQFCDKAYNPKYICKYLDKGEA